MPGSMLGCPCGAALGSGAADTRGAYQRQLMELLPPGIVWRLLGDSQLSRFLLAAAEELGRLHCRAGDMLIEVDTTTTGELLTDWEGLFGLRPADGDLPPQRRAAVTARLVRRQRFRPIDYQRALAPILGQDVEDVDVRERTRANVIPMAVILSIDQREIFRYFIYRDPGLPGNYSVTDAQALVDAMQPAHTKGYVIESIDFKTDDPLSLTDRDLLGA